MLLRIPGAGCDAEDRGMAERGKPITMRGMLGSASFHAKTCFKRDDGSVRLTPLVPLPRAQHLPEETSSRAAHAHPTESLRQRLVLAWRSICPSPEGALHRNHLKV
jgi:hypothetical protein